MAYAVQPIDRLGFVDRLCAPWSLLAQLEDRSRLAAPSCDLCGTPRHRAVADDRRDKPRYTFAGGAISPALAPLSRDHFDRASSDRKRVGEGKGGSGLGDY